MFSFYTLKCFSVYSFFLNTYLHSNVRSRATGEKYFVRCNNEFSSTVRWHNTINQAKRSLDTIGSDKCAFTFSYLFRYIQYRPVYYVMYIHNTSALYVALQRSSFHCLTPSRDMNTNSTTKVYIRNNVERATLKLFIFLFNWIDGTTCV